jgi:hypothetical protein
VEACKRNGVVGRIGNTMPIIPSIREKVPPIKYNPLFIFSLKVNSF